MSRRLFSVAKQVCRLAVVAKPSVRPPVVAFTRFSVRSFSADHGHSHGDHHAKAETFLDAKEVTDRIIDVIKNFEKVNASKVTVGARFKEDLDLDSLDAVEVVMAIEEEFCIEIPDSEADKILSIPDAVHYISNHPMAK